MTAIALGALSPTNKINNYTYVHLFIKIIVLLVTAFSVLWEGMVQAMLDLPTVARIKLELSQPERSFPCSSISMT